MHPLFLRADATPEIGAGHVMRCVTLGVAWRAAAGGPVMVAGEVSLEFVQRRLEEARIVLLPPDAEIPSGATLVVDSYDTAVRSSGAVQSAVLRVLLDDLGGSVPAGFDVVINPNAYADAHLYPEFRGLILAGPDFLLLRNDLPSSPTEAGTGTGVLVGGTGMDRTLSAALGLVIARRPDFGPFVSVGAGAPVDWRAASTVAPWHSLASCAQVLVAAGGATWEAAAVGVPVVLLLVADNQASIAEWAVNHGVPTVDLRTGWSPAALADSLVTALDTARPLPKVTGGTGRLIDRLIGTALAHDA